jgi:hypothetical protein
MERNETEVEVEWDASCTDSIEAWLARHENGTPYDGNDPNVWAFLNS